MPFTFAHKNSGEVIKADEWNELMDEIDKRVKIAGDTMTGPLRIDTNLSFGSQTRQMLNLWSTEYGLGVQSFTLYFRSFSDFAFHRGGTHNDGRQVPGAGGARLMAVSAAGDLILSARSNPNSEANKSACRALVNWKADANSPDELHINWSNDFAGGTFIGSDLIVSQDLRIGTQTAQNMISIDRGAFNRGGLVVIGGGGTTQNLLLSMSTINSGETVPDYNFAVGHWVNSSIQIGPGAARLPTSNFEAKFRVYANGNAKCDGTFIGGGADYAELLESTNGVPIPIGTSVVFTEKGKVSPAQAGETPLGVVSANPAMLGNNPGEWPGKYLRDESGLPILVDGQAQLNPAYDPNQVYLQRMDRPEWNKVGILGQLRLKKGQPTAAAWTKIQDLSDDWELWLVK